MVSEKGEMRLGYKLKLTCKRSCDEHGCKSANTSHKWRIPDIPIMSTNVFMFSVAAAIHSDAKQDEDLSRSEDVNLDAQFAYNNGYDFEQTQPVLNLRHRVSLKLLLGILSTYFTISSNCNNIRKH